MTSFKGFVYSKLHAIGTKSEGPSYYLQTYSPSGEELKMKYHEVNPWEPDKDLEKMVNHKVKVEGDLEKSRPPVLKVTKIEKIKSWIDP